jgi:AcrR family transcriptional regulator
MNTTKSPSEGSSAKRTRRGPYTRKQILDASLRLFSERGFASTTVRDIARLAGITDAAIYYHFASKRELLEARVDEGGCVTSLQNLERFGADAPISGALLWMARGAINLMDENREFLRLIIMEGLGGDEAAIGQYRRLVDLWEGALTTVLQRYADKGEFPKNSPPHLARHIVYTILMAFQDSLIGRHVSAHAAPEQRQQELTEFVAPAIIRMLNQNS